MRVRASIFALLTLLLVGCSAVTHTSGDGRWFNTALPIHLQSTFYEQEAAFCTQAADRWVPMPEVRYDFRGARLINGSPNASVHGGGLSATVSETKSSLVMASPGSDISAWRTLGAPIVRGNREASAERNCMATLGWKPVDNTWDGTPTTLNQSIAVNRAVMSAVSEGYSHPLLGEGVIALIDVGGSGFVDSDIVIQTTEIPLYATDQTRRCRYLVASGWWSRRSTVMCENLSESETKVAPTSPLATWLKIYF